MWSWPTGPACRWRSWPQRPSRGLGGYGASRSCCSRSWARQDFPSEYHTILRDSVAASFDGLWFRALLHGGLMKFGFENIKDALDVLIVPISVGLLALIWPSLAARKRRKNFVYLIAQELEEA